MDSNSKEYGILDYHDADSFCDLSRAITVDEVIARVREGLTEMFERNESANAVGE